MVTTGAGGGEGALVETIGAGGGEVLEVEEVGCCWEELSLGGISSPNIRARASAYCRSRSSVLSNNICIY